MPDESYRLEVTIRVSEASTRSYHSKPIEGEARKLETTLPDLEATIPILERLTKDALGRVVSGLRTQTHIKESVGVTEKPF